MLKDHFTLCVEDRRKESDWKLGDWPGRGRVAFFSLFQLMMMVMVAVFFFFW